MGVDRRQSVTRRQRDEQFPMLHPQWVKNGGGPHVLPLAPHDHSK
jgi:hypothetical protein